jgi:hypothetical protein
MMRPNLRILTAGAALTGVVGAAGCDAIWGVHAARLYVVDAGDAGRGGAGGTGGTTSSSSTTGTGGGAVCTPNAMMPCYSGPVGTEGVGQCQAGLKTCKPDGSDYGACTGDVTPQPETCSNPANESCSGHDCVQWAELFGDNNDQAAKGVAVDPSGNSFVAGSFAGAISVPGAPLVAAGMTDAFLIKLDPAGMVLWGKGFGAAAAYVNAYTVAANDAGEVVIGGTATKAVSFGGTPIAPGLFLAKFSANGDLLWSKGLTVSYGGQLLEKVYSVVFAPGGDVVAGGTFASPIDVDDGPIAGPSAGTPVLGFVTRLRGSDGSGKSANGKWAKSLCSGSNVCGVWGVAADAAGDVIVAGKFGGTLVLAPGVSMTSVGTKFNAYVAKLSPNGDTSPWNRQIGAAGADISVTALGIDASDAPVLVGNFTGTLDFGGGPVTGVTGSGYVARYSASNSFGWVKAFDGTAFGVASDASGNAFVTGSFPGSLDLGGAPLTSNGGADVFVAKLSPSGALLWNRGYGGAEDQAAAGVGITSQGDPVIVGSTSGPIDFGMGTLTPKGGADLFVVKLSQ